MTEYLFPDNTVLCNFAAVNRLDLLESVLNTRGRWTEAVAYEAEQSARVLPALGAAELRRWLGEPIEITKPAHIQRVQRIRRLVFGGDDTKPLQHLGEAEACFVLKEQPEFVGSWWITDDREALRHAKFQGITARETIDLMTIAVANGDTSARSAYDLMLAMHDEGRRLRLPASVRSLQG